MTKIDDIVSRLALAVAVSTGLMLAANAPAAGTEPDTVFVNGKIITLDAQDSIAPAVAVKDGRIVGVGSTEAIKGQAGPATKVIDLGGKTVVPGLIDTHAHPTIALSLMETAVNARYPDIKSVKDALAALAARAKTTPKGQWILVVGSSASETKYAEKRVPLKAELDQAAPDNPVVFFNGLHEFIVNSLALKEMGAKKGVPTLPHGGVVALDANGEPTGELFETRADIPSPVTEADLKRYFAKEIPNLWNRYGYTTIMAIIEAVELDVLNAYATSGEAPPTIRYATSVWTDPSGRQLPADLSKVAVAKAADPDYFRTGGVKIWIDGEVDARSGLLYEPYVGYSPDHPAPTDFDGGKGLLVTPQDQADAVASEASKAGMITMIHTSGDRSMDIALNAFDKARKAGGTTIMRIEHFGIFVMKDDQLKRAKDLAITIDLQPAWLNFLGKADQDLLGPERAKTGFRFRSMVDAGLEPAGGTDMSGVYPEAVDPFLHIWTAVTRTSDIGVLQPEQAISVEDALKMWTIWAAKSIGQADVKGSIEPGKYADLTVLSDDILTIAPAKLRDVHAVKTIVGGKVVYSAE
ncbi:MAG: amidohydrolase [Rhodoplanes sp.]